MARILRELADIKFRLEGVKPLTNFLLEIYRAFPSPIIFVPFIVAVAITGPFGTFYDLNFWQRLIFWGGAMIGCGVLFNGAIILVLFSGWFGQISRPWKIVIACILAGPPGAWLLGWINGVFRGSSLDLEFFLWLWVCVTVVGIPISLMQYLWRQQALPGVEQPHYSVPLLRRLPPEIGDELVSLSAQDHYVEVVTGAGKELVLINFTQALQELDGYPGMQIHRSHWVATSAIAAVEGSGRKQTVRTTDGRSLPISRAKIPEVRALVDG